MTQYCVTSKYDRSTLFEGRFNSFQDCLETAVREKTDLYGADLSFKNLSNFNLDDALLNHADFSHSNLTGCNLSESMLQHARFGGTTLLGVCLAYSMLNNAEFSGTQFGATDITGAILSGARFNTLSFLSLPFAGAGAAEECVFTDEHSHSSRFSGAPVAIFGAAKHTLSRIGDDMRCGHNLITHDEWQSVLHAASHPAQKHLSA